MMRQDQIERLNELSEKLTDVFLEEADPSFWPGSGQTADQMSQQARGDRYWCKKNAAATMVLIGGVVKLQENTKEALGRDPYNDQQLDKKIAEAEQRAQALVEKVVKSASTAARAATTSRKANGR